jgi:glycosyltransferase involved in cell wall biosynthesis
MWSNFPSPVKVVSQTFKDWELVIGLNVSGEASALIRNDLREELIDPRIRIITDSAPKNMADNWNAAIRESKGDYIKLLCHDDLLYPDSLERQVRALQSNPAAVVASGARTIINSKGKVLFNRSGIRKTGLYPGRAMIRRCIMAGSNIIGDPVNVMWRRSAMEKVGHSIPRSSTVRTLSTGYASSVWAISTMTPNQPGFTASIEMPQRRD